MLADELFLLWHVTNYRTESASLMRLLIFPALRYSANQFGIHLLSPYYVSNTANASAKFCASCQG